MATISFTREFAITKKETVDRLEQSVQHIKPVKISSRNVVADLQRSERKLLNTLRSKA
ncbi:hypothetical protein SCACP_25900 [Sporomusa carbonis]